MLPYLRDFVVESNRIEGITQTDQREVQAHYDFLALDRIAVMDVEVLRDVMAPHEKLRDAAGMEVWIGGRQAPPGGPMIRARLFDLLSDIASGLGPYEAHRQYEYLHPMTDGNGRTGRAIWLWQMVRLGGGVPRLGFLHTWYYQSLSEGGERVSAKSMSESRRLRVQKGMDGGD